MDEIKEKSTDEQVEQDDIKNEIKDDVKKLFKDELKKSLINDILVELKNEFMNTTYKVEPKEPEQEAKQEQKTWDDFLRKEVN